MNTLLRITKYVAIGTLAASIALSACKRKKDDEAVDPDPDLTTERDISNSDNDANSILADIDRALDNATSANLREEAVYYATITRKDTNTTQEGLSYDKMLTIEYTGSGYDNQSRSGLVTVYYTGTRIIGDFKSYVTFSNTKVGGRTITGKRIITQEPSGDLNQWKFSVKAAGTVTTIDGRTLNYTSDRTRVRRGISTLGNLSDDSFTITGSWVGTNGNGESVTAVIASALQLSYSCHYFREITAGKITFTNATRGTIRSIDYGSGGCDGKGTFVTAKGRVYNFFFKR
jgi:hypothetical protein